MVERAKGTDHVRRCQLLADAVEKGLRTSPNSDSADSMDHLLGGGDDGAAE